MATQTRFEAKHFDILVLLCHGLNDIDDFLLGVADNLESEQISQVHPRLLDGDPPLMTDLLDLLCDAQDVLLVAQFDSLAENPVHVVREGEKVTLSKLACHGCCVEG